MKSDLVVHEQRPYELTDKQVAIIANTEFVPKEKRGKHDVIWASIFHGRSLGLDDMTAIQKIWIINGTPAIAAIVSSGIATQRGHKIEGDMSATSATARGTRGDNGATMEVTFTIEDAKAAGLASKQVYKQHPQSMLWARAVTQLCRSLFPDCFIGGVYTREELGEDFVDAEDVIDVTSSEVADEPFVEPIPDEADDVPEPTQMDLLLATYGREKVVAAYRELFPPGTRKDGEVSEADIAMLADELSSTKTSTAPNTPNTGKVTV